VGAVAWVRGWFQRSGGPSSDSIAHRKAMRSVKPRPERRPVGHRQTTSVRTSIQRGREAWRRHDRAKTFVHSPSSAPTSLESCCRFNGADARCFSPSTAGAQPC
jgi:hypothetical protein